MNYQRIISFSLVSLVSLNLGCLIGLAEVISERYPTTTELQRLREKLSQQIRSLSNSGSRDVRSQAEKQRRESFVNSWSRVDRSVAPFLGDWLGYEEGLAVYPSNRRGRVCLIYISPQEAEFSLGNVSNGTIRTNARTTIIKEGDFLGIATVINNGADILVETPYFSPRILRSPRDYARSSATSAQEIEQVVRQFNAAGCTANLPSSR